MFTKQRYNKRLKQHRIFVNIYSQIRITNKTLVINVIQTTEAILLFKNLQKILFIARRELYLCTIFKYNIPAGTLMIGNNFRDINYV